MKSLVAVGAVVLALLAGLGLWVTASMRPSDAQRAPVIADTQPAATPDAANGAGLEQPETAGASAPSDDAGDSEDRREDPDQHEQEAPDARVRQPAPERDSSGSAGGSGPREVAPQPRAPSDDDDDYDEDNDDDDDDEDDDDD